ncbi:MAG: hypothetical protein WCB04_14960 [Mycobacteriales bacterium]
MSLLDKLRRDRPPAGATASLDADDRLLSWASTTGGYVVASRRGLRLPGERFVPWHRVDKAVWRDGVLQIIEAVQDEPGVMRALAPATYELAEPRNLPSVVQARVTQSVASTSRHPLPGRDAGAIRVVARRVAGQDGLDWSVRYESGADGGDPEVRRAAERLLAEVRAASTPAE